MQIQINTDKNIDGNERLVNFYTSELQNELKRFDDKITRIEVHLGDENSTKFGLNDKKCLIEIRIANKQPIAVTGNAETLEKAFYSAIEKSKKVLETTFEKLRSN
ncbi:MAG: HPF/RaiA family ribosome-associated protein [Flavobacterium sp.]|uniref:HPF/RaiA family ribosome-associated protein n=1 Tax=Flavobacterium sp. TaxID=239 RepID=UPI00261692F3|nr:HPF/RaiA family ribosome-associated protein [Flavobacterium sp.]MDD5150525.1 HPF/RaiA family ribosome-associated protein [Flavobacterium sp.]